MCVIKKILTVILSFLLAQNVLAQPSSLELNHYNNEPSFYALDSIVLKDGFHIPIGKTVLISVGGFPNLTSLPTGTQNYILTRTFRTPIKQANLSSVRTIDQENQTVQYFDGLGRPIQQVEVMASPSYKDIVQHIEYDGFGRETIKYLPYAEQSSSNGSFKTAAKINQSNFYKVGGGWDTHVKKTPNPYAVTVFENSPLNRVSQQGSPGAAWQPIANRDLAAATGRTVETEYGTNVTTGTEAVKLWKVTYAGGKASGAGSTSNYGAGKLYKTITKDENWIAANGKGGTVEEFKDFQSRLVLKRIWESNTKALNTYYVYDDLGDLCYVIPPIVAINSFTEVSTDVNFSRYIYGYHYNNRRRLIEKKIPGKGWEWMAYNANDQEVLRQDALQRATGSWTYTKYDAFGRVAHTGIYTKAGLITQAAAQSAVDTHPKVNNVQHLWEERLGTLNYVDRAFPIGETVIPHVINYYDDYTFNGATTAALQTIGVTKSQKTKTLLTGMRVTTVDGMAELLTINYYDDRGRLIQSASQNQLGGTDYVTNTYNFPGELLTSKRQHKASASGTVTTILTTNIYDHVGRLEQTKKKVNTQAEILQSSLAYNEIGQLKQKDLHGIGTAAVQQISYAYNERGWTTSINNPAAVSAKKRFGMTLIYGGNTRAYNGNIASVQWNTKVATGQTQTPVQTYSYSYDMLSRLKKAAYTASGKNNFFNEELAYDVMGNIDTLRRTNGSTGWYNHFKYTYVGNQLNKVTDSGTAKRTNAFSYDANGNGRTDSRLGVTEIQYNYLNLPKKFVNGSQNLLYTYDALGNKRTKTLGAAVTEYVDGIQYKNGVIEFIQTEEGRILPSGSSFIYEYFLTDHLGNTRAVIDHTGAIKQIQDYYAFGMEMNTGAGLNTASNLYKYNGKEKQVELQLDQLDYGARFYNAEIGRWNVIDPLAEVHYNLTGYNYVMSNPILYFDLHGLDTASSTSNGYLIEAVEVWGRTSSSSGSTSLWLKGTMADIGSYGSDHPYFTQKSWYADYRRQVDAARDPALDLMNFASFASGIGEGYLVARGGIFLLKGGVPILIKRIGLRSAAKTGGRVFWSGEGAMSTALNFAKSTGGTTLEMTRAGQNLQNLIQTRNIPWSEARPMWQRLSTKFAQGAEGSVHFFPGTTVNPGSIWLNVEKPILFNNGVKIITH